MRPIEADGSARMCGACDRPVYDSRSLTRAALAQLIARHEGRLPCLRLHRRPDGTVVTRSCFAPVLRAGRFLWLKVGLAAAAFWTAVAASWSWTRRPAAAVIESAETATAEAQKLPFTIKPPAEASSPPRTSPKLHAKKRGTRTFTITLGRPAVDD